VSKSPGRRAAVRPGGRPRSVARWQGRICVSNQGGGCLQPHQPPRYGILRFMSDNAQNN
jgi:hypothetical protein